MISYRYASPVGTLIITGDGHYITGCAFAEDEEAKNESAEGAEGVEAAMPDDGIIRQCVAELDGYFSGTLTRFTVPIKTVGTPFSKETWARLQEIPYGATISYRELAKCCGNPKAVRAVGGANHRNPIVIIIPCHRVIGANGQLTGYGGGLERKRFLLDLEQKNNH